MDDDPATVEHLIGLLRRLTLALIALAMALVVAMGVLWWWQYHQDPTDKLIVVAVDAADGKILWQGKPGTYKVEDIWVEGSLQRWLEYCRWRPDDRVLQQQYKERCLAMTTGQARADMEEYWKQRETETLGTNRMRVELGDWKRHRESPATYRFAWTEKWTPLIGIGAKPVRMVATLTVDLRTKRETLKAGDVQMNDLGVYVTTIFWDEERVDALSTFAPSPAQ